MLSRSSKTYELITVGFGPAALAVAAAIDDAVRAGELPRSMGDDVLFLEKQVETKWQGGLLLPGTNINHSALRDLATPRDPASPYTFARYLKQKGRLYEHGAWSGAVGRIEWSDYVSWAAAQLDAYVAYGEPVEAIELDCDGTLCVISARTRYRTRRLMLACGMEPYCPPVLDALPDDRMRHSGSYLYYRGAIDARIRESDNRPFRIAIVGSGLSAAEIMHDLLDRHDSDRIAVTSIHRGLAFRQYDMSQFSNQIYMPPEVDRFAAAAAETRRKLFEKTWATNFSGVDAECSAREYNFLYERRLMGIDNATLIDRHEIVNASATANGVLLELADMLEVEKTRPFEFDFVIAATGYQDTAPERLLRPIAAEIEHEFDGRLAIDRSYRLRTSQRVTTPIFLNGHCEHTHGIADTQSFSLIAFKAEQLLGAMFYSPVRAAALQSSSAAHGLAAIR